MKFAHDEPECQVWTRQGCGGCALLKEALREAGVEFVERNANGNFEDMALACWYDLPETVPQVVVGGEAIPYEMRDETWPTLLTAEVKWRIEALCNA